METSGECSKGYLVLSHRTSTSKSIFSNVRLQPKHSFTTLPATIPKHTVGGCCLLSLEYHFNSSMSKLCTHCKVYWIRRRICFGHPIKLQFHSSWWGVLILYSWEIVLFISLDSCFPFFPLQLPPFLILPDQLCLLSTCPLHFIHSMSIDLDWCLTFKCQYHSDSDRRLF